MQRAIDRKDKTGRTVAIGYRLLGSMIADESRGLVDTERDERRFRVCKKSVPVIGKRYWRRYSGI